MRGWANGGAIGPGPLGKPFSASTKSSRVDRYRRRAQKAGGPFLLIGAVTPTPSVHEVQECQRSSHLTEEFSSRTSILHGPPAPPLPKVQTPGSRPLFSTMHPEQEMRFAGLSCLSPWQVRLAAIVTVALTLKLSYSQKRRSHAAKDASQPIVSASHIFPAGGCQVLSNRARRLG
ncbi:hypothetical protein PaG_01511 [Moesziomyces aphidis]|uniref:Uncharacterized protein n=1 Tax=Moesziomyces aphidis TaxID=84754 RepID=W3VRV5_MOEAP|nr:hypothetical protein PaG_01511 [Moesziomyces aphidis]